ncbi:hypothetical protein [Janthinobacterium fluminis]|uniref:Uncharacterized protein n=1 Tax=Janthinobacterium fluminis TaxID=2987524 RepID=A0ABT5JV14_9BURK|nr:hypothetical protein [Janthinobacterium fluminis]MDC8756255.1 hypothetical protein [Janthinobacterium fluminis]
MMELIAKQAFSWAHRGVEIEQFAQGQSIETDDADLIAVALAEGWAKDMRTKAKNGSPENKEA